MHTTPTYDCEECRVTGAPCGIGDGDMSLVRNVYSAPQKTVTLAAIMNDIRTGVYARAVARVQQLSGAQRDKAKAQLPAFTPSGTFRGRRRAANLERHSGRIVLDFDGVANPAAVRDAAFAMPGTVAAFVSTGGAGVKVIAEAAGAVAAHRSAFDALADRYEDALGVAVDRSGSDVTRLCFVSHDPDARMR